MANTLIKQDTFGDILREWRKVRRFSQLTFSLYAQISSRHLSFLETGRANPSREMILKLARCLDMPKFEVNRALEAAGFVPAYFARAQSDVDLAPLHQAISMMLTNHSPYPAVVFDQLWNIVDANDVAKKFLGDADFAGSSNLIEILAAQSETQSSIVNWRQTISLLLERLRTEIREGCNGLGLVELEQKLAANYHLHYRELELDRSKAVIATQFLIGGNNLSLFSTIAQFGTVQDMVLDSLRVEMMFAHDEDTRSYFRNAR